MTKSTPCAQCQKKPVDPAYRPFCSKRCADLDLGQWLKGGYAIPGAPVDLEEDELGAGQPLPDADEGRDADEDDAL